jgi:hypothetical protein
MAEVAAGSRVAEAAVTEEEAVVDTHREAAVVECEAVNRDNRR